MADYSAKDLERWTAFLEDKSHGQEVPPSVGAQLIADVRREALEDAAQIADANDLPGTAEDIRALKDGAKDPAHLARVAGAVGFGDGTYMPDAPKCKVCGEGPDHDGHNKHARGPGLISFYHTYRPEVALKDKP